jgi:hypothetical protein
MILIVIAGTKYLRQDNDQVSVELDSLVLDVLYYIKIGTESV